MAGQHQQNGTGGNVIRPVETVELYKFKTDDIRNFLQERIEILGKMYRTVQGKTVADAQITVRSHESSKIYYPLIVILPDSVIVNDGKSDDESEVDVIMRENGDNPKLNIAKNVWDCLYPFMYDKGDRKSFLNSESHRASVKVSREEGKWLAKYCYPRVIEVGPKSNRSRYVLVLLDPVRIFKYRLKKENEAPNRFKLEIHVNKIYNDGSNCCYEVKKFPNNSKKHKDRDIELVVEQAMRNNK